MLSVRGVSGGTDKDTLTSIRDDLTEVKSSIEEASNKIDQNHTDITDEISLNWDNNFGYGKIQRSIYKPTSSLNIAISRYQWDFIGQIAQRLYVFKRRDVSFSSTSTEIAYVITNNLSMFSTLDAYVDGALIFLPARQELTFSEIQDNANYGINRCAPKFMIDTIRTGYYSGNYEYLQRSRTTMIGKFGEGSYGTGYLNIYTYHFEDEAKSAFTESIFGLSMSNSQQDLAGNYYHDIIMDLDYGAKSGVVFITYMLYSSLHYQIYDVTSDNGVFTWTLHGSKSLSEETGRVIHGQDSKLVLYDSNGGTFRFYAFSGSSSGSEPWLYSSKYTFSNSTATYNALQRHPFIIYAAYNGYLASYSIGDYSTQTLKEIMWCFPKGTMLDYEIFDVSDLNIKASDVINMEVDGTLNLLKRILLVSLTRFSIVSDKYPSANSNVGTSSMYLHSLILNFGGYQISQEVTHALVLHNFYNGPINEFGFSSATVCYLPYQYTNSTGMQTYNRKILTDAISYSTYFKLSAYIEIEGTNKENYWYERVYYLYNATYAHIVDTFKFRNLFKDYNMPSVAKSRARSKAKITTPKFDLISEIEEILSLFNTNNENTNVLALDSFRSIKGLFGTDVLMNYDIEKLENVYTELKYIQSITANEYNVYIPLQQYIEYTLDVLNGNTLKAEDFDLESFLEETKEVTEGKKD